MSRGDNSITMELIRQAQAGDETAFNDLLARYYDRIRALARQRIGRRLRRDFDSQDIVQDSMMVAARKLPDFQLGSQNGLMPWMRTIVENQIRACADWQQAKCRRRDGEVAAREGQEGRARERHRDSPSPIDELTNVELRLVLDMCLSKLGGDYEKIVRARHFEGMTWEKIATALDRPSADAARMMYRTAIVKLTLLLHRRARDGV